MIMTMVIYEFISGVNESEKGQRGEGGAHSFGEAPRYLPFICCGELRRLKIRGKFFRSRRSFISSPL